MYVYIYIYMYMSLSLYLSLSLYIYIYIYMHTPISLSLCIYIYIYVSSQTLWLSMLPSYQCYHMVMTFKTAPEQGRHSILILRMLLILLRSSQFCYCIQTAGTCANATTATISECTTKSQCPGVHRRPQTVVLSVAQHSMSRLCQDYI